MGSGNASSEGPAFSIHPRTCVDRYGAASLPQGPRAHKDNVTYCQPRLSGWATPALCSALPNWLVQQRPLAQPCALVQPARHATSTGLSGHVHRLMDLSSIIMCALPLAGSGYLVAVFAKLVLPGGTVLGLEKVPELVRGIVCAYCGSPQFSIPHAGAWHSVCTLRQPIVQHSPCWCVEGCSAKLVLHTSA